MLFDTGEKIKPGLEFSEKTKAPVLKTKYRKYVEAITPGRFTLVWEKQLDGRGKHLINISLKIKYYRLVIIDKKSDTVVMDMYGDENALWFMAYHAILKRIRV